jgi:hypothetical protein
MPQILNEGTDLEIEQCLKVFDALYPRARRKQLVHVAAPARWVFAAAIHASFGPIQNSLDAAAHPVSGVPPLGPDGLDDAKDRRRVYPIHR